jgi:hypothetical protein
MSDTASDKLNQGVALPVAVTHQLVEAPLSQCMQLCHHAHIACGVSQPLVLPLLLLCLSCGYAQRCENAI